MSSEQTVRDLLERADIRVDGKRPEDIQVLNPKFYDRLLAEGSLAVGETYMDAWWECKRIDALVAKAVKAKLDQLIHGWREIWDTARAILLNPQLKYHAFYNAQRHYDIGADIYEKMLDRRKIYSCGYWSGAKTLDQAQKNKLDLIFRKIGLKRGMSLLDIGCGWGGLAKYAAKKYGAKVVGITVSENQYEEARENCRGLPVKIKLQDYRDLQGHFDRIVSVGMFEHVGYKNYRHFMKVAHRCLEDDGIFLLHSIGSNESGVRIDPWIQRYIFPNAMLPSIKQIGAASEGLFVMEDWHNFGPDYDKTLMAWYKNFNRHWKEIKKNYDERFYRMWKFYLLSCAGSFRARELQVWQVLFSKGGIRMPRLR